MTIDDMHFLIDLQKYQNYSQACSDMHFSRQGLYKRLKRIENELGYPLFESSGHKYTLTPRGVSACTSFATIIELYNALLGSKSEEDSPTVPYVIFSVTRSLFPQLIPELNNYLSAIKNNFYGTQIDCVFATNEECFQYVADDKVSGGIILGLPQEISEYWNIALQEYPLYVTMTKSHFYANRQKLLLEDIAMYPCLFFGTPEQAYRPIFKKCREKNPLWVAKDCEHDYNFYNQLLDGKTLLISVSKIPDALSQVFVSRPLSTEYHASLLFIGRNDRPFSAFIKKIAEELVSLVSNSIIHTAE